MTLLGTLRLFILKHAMNELEIAQVLRAHCLTKKYFAGVYARDELLKRKKKGLFIINTAKRSEPGEHWVLVFFSPRGATYFDSFGMPPLHSEILNFVDANMPVQYNKEQLQNVYSTVCGQYACVFAAKLAAGYSMQEIRAKYFSRNTLLNDSIIKALFKKEFGRTKKTKNLNGCLSCCALCKK